MGLSLITKVYIQTDSSFLIPDSFYLLLGIAIVEYLLQIIMDILPHNFTEFKDKKYWDHFFTSLKNTSNQYFQWYGAYEDYQHLLQHLIQSTDSSSSDGIKNIFHVGCGKSTFTQHLLNQNQKQNELKIINCDYSQNVIKQMKQRAIKQNIKMQYIVCDLLAPLQQQFSGLFDIILDKGTLDAMLPQDNPINISRIKQKYFKNMQIALATKNNKKPKFIIISLLQPFVLRTILQHYGFVPNFTIDIYECLVKDSKMQPFLISISYFGQSKQQASEVRFHRLGKDEIVKWLTIKQVMQGIQNIQKQVGYGHKVKELIAGRRAKFNIYNENNRKLIRYLIEVVDSENKEILAKNSCSIFVVPQGKQNSYLFNDPDGIKSLHAQIGTSRVLIVKLITGNTFNNLDQIKKELNEVIPNFIQNGCQIKKVSYLTDADQLGNRKYLFQQDDDDFILDQVVVEGQCIRRLFLRSNVLAPQCQFKLTYLSQANNKQLKDIGSNIMPSKKGMVVGIDRQELFDDYARFIYSGLTAFYSHPRQGGWKVLILGCQFALAKFLSQNYQNIEVTIVCGNHKSAKTVLRKYLELQEDSENLIIHSISPTQFFGDHSQQKFNLIIDCTKQGDGQNPSRQQTSSQFLQKVVHMLELPGIYVCQYQNYMKMPAFDNHFFPVYGSMTNLLNGQDQNIVFCLMFNKKQIDGKVLLHENLVKFKPKAKADYQWQSDNFEDIVMLQPKVINEKGKHLSYDMSKILIQSQTSFEDIYATQSGKSEKKKKKKKKK